MVLDICNTLFVHVATIISRYIYHVYRNRYKDYLAFLYNILWPFKTFSESSKFSYTQALAEVQEKFFYVRRIASSVLLPILLYAC